jgi:hypothetical protein
MTTITSQLASQIKRAIEAIPEAHRKAPAHESIVSNPDVAFEHL